MKIKASAGRVCAAATVLAALVTAGVAWACIPQPLLVVEPPASARAGDAVTVRGLNFRGRAELRLDGVDGTRLAVTSGNTFSVRVDVPQVKAGLHTLVGVIRDPDGRISGTASAPLDVVSAQRGSGSAGTPSAGTGSSRPKPSASSGISAGPAAAGGVLLLALGVLLGALLARRRARAASP